jgi:hypothetical protein
MYRSGKHFARIQAFSWQGRLKIGRDYADVMDAGHHMFNLLLVVVTVKIGLYPGP